MMSALEQKNKPHRKQKERSGHDSSSNNPKAFAFSSPGHFQRQAARAQDVKEKRLHVPLVDRMPEELPPLIVAVVGPPKVGKTTLVKSLIRRYTKQTVSDPKGPLTVVTSKRRRLTFIETPADSLAAMIDVSKVADIVLLMIDGKYGFEMEIMEFLDVLKTSGMPGSVIGILTHLDLFTKPDTLRTQKKRLKTRLWKDLYQGAKLFYLSGVINGRYPDREVLNLSRFLAVMKNPRPLVWRNSHPYCIADRFLDITPPTEIEINPKCDRKIALYGYARGTNFAAHNAHVHVPGLGDCVVSNIEPLPDPCPTPYQEQMKAQMTGKSPRQKLGDKQKILYAPMSDVGGLLIDKDAVYIEVKNPTFGVANESSMSSIENRGLGEQLVLGLQGNRKLLGRADNSVQLFDDGSDLHKTTSENGVLTSVGEMSEDSASDDSDEDEKSETSSSEGSQDCGLSSDPKQPFMDTQDDLFAESDSDIEDVVSGSQNSDDDETGRSILYDHITDNDVLSSPHFSRLGMSIPGTRFHMRGQDLSRLIYDLSLEADKVVQIWTGQNQIEKSDLQPNDETILFTPKHSQSETIQDEDRLLPIYDYDVLSRKWSSAENLIMLKQKFTGSHSGNDNGGFNPEYGPDSHDGSNSEGDGAFEDLEVEQNEGGNPLTFDLEEQRMKNAKRKEELKLRFEEEDRDGLDNDKVHKSNDAADLDGEFGEDQWYDVQKAKIQKQLDINRAEFDALDEGSRAKIEGYKAGTYMRLTLLDVPYEFVAYFQPQQPIIVGGINATEERFGYLQVRMKKHRYYQKVLKNKDPLIFSLGWRRFESIPIFATSDHSIRQRMIKYTPEHDHCLGTFWGPLAAPNTGFCCVQSFSNNNPKFRLAAIGTILSVDESVNIVKKVKLKGYPGKILKNTAYIRDMFSSDLEVEKFKSAKLKTVSGVRGMVKAKAGHKFPQGWIRATFEDKILMSDIVFLTGWHSVQPPEYYNTVTNLLMDGDNNAGSEWLGMRTTGRVRAETGLATPQLKDSQYHNVERANRHFNPLRVPRKLAVGLPYKSQIVQLKPQRKTSYLTKRAVVLNADEKRARDLIQKVSTLQNEKSTKREAAQEKRRVGYRKKVAGDLLKKEAREKRERDEYWRHEGRKRKVEEGGSDGAVKKRR